MKVHTQHYGKLVDVAGVKGTAEADRTRELTPDRPQWSVSNCATETAPAKK